ncbi:hypothetical protein BDW62DRAFT_195409 [Aspergillus aurantiobrunneus]
MAGQRSDDAEYIPLAPQNPSTESQHDEPAYEKPGSKPRNVRQRMGPIAALALIPGSALLLFPVAVLTLIWKESMRASTGAEPHTLWLDITNAGWISRLVTISTAVMRFIVAIQTSQVTAMLASIVLESVGTPLLYAPFYSTVRAAKNAPIDFLLATWLRGQRSFLSFFVWILIITQILTTVASQFLSTLLISDLTNDSFTNRNNSIQVPLVTRGTPSASARWWSMPPSSSWAFGELSDPFSAGPGYHDTGHTYHAFLPFQNETQRTQLREYRGPAPVTDYRVVCMNPSLMNISYTRQEGLVPQLSGQIAVDYASYPMLRNATNPRYINFACALPMTVNRPNGETALCAPGELTDGTVVLQDPIVPGIFNYTLAATYADVPSGAMVILLDVVSLASTPTTGGANNLQLLHSDGPWAVINNGSDAEFVRVTACTTNLVSKTFSLGMQSSEDRHEPQVSWDRDSGRYDTTNTRRQLGLSSTPDTLNERGLLSLEPRSQWTNYTIDIETLNTSLVGDYLPDPLSFTSPLLSALPVPYQQFLSANATRNNAGLILSESYTVGVGHAHLLHVHHFQDTLRDTGSPALALQSLVIRSSQMDYYANLVKFPPAEPLQAAFAVTALMPSRWTGFTISMAIVATHLAVVIITMSLFSMYTRTSLIGNYWQALSHLVSEDTLPVLKSAGSMTDEDVGRMAGYPGLGLESVGFLRRRDGRLVISQVQSGSGHRL